MTLQMSQSVRFIVQIPLFFTITSTLAFGDTEAASPRIIEQVPVYAVAGRFGGWPANHGIWSWGNEIVVGFSAGYYKDLGPGIHAIDRHKPEYHLLAQPRWRPLLDN